MCNDIVRFLKKNEIINAKIIPFRREETVCNSRSKNGAICLFENDLKPFQWLACPHFYELQLRHRLEQFK